MGFPLPAAISGTPTENTEELGANPRKPRNPQKPRKHRRGETEEAEEAEGSCEEPRRNKSNLSK